MCFSFQPNDPLFQAFTSAISVFILLQLCKIHQYLSETHSCLALAVVWNNFNHLVAVSFFYSVSVKGLLLLRLDNIFHGLMLNHGTRLKK